MNVWRKPATRLYPFVQRELPEGTRGQLEIDANVCIYCGAEENLTTEHILPRSRGGEDVPDNVVRVCKACNSQKGAKGLYEWKGLQEKNSHNRIAEGKYLKYIYSRYERAGMLDVTLKDLCPCCLAQKCADEGHAEKFTLYCLEGYFAYRGYEAPLAKKN